MSVDTLLERLKQELAQEERAGRINNLEALADSQVRRTAIDQYWQAIQKELQAVQQTIKALPTLPDTEQIRWAQAVAWMHNLAFMEIDTTGLQEEEDLVRFTLFNGKGEILDDFFIKPVTRQLTRKVSEINGIQPEHVEQQGVDLPTAWSRMRKAMEGRYVLSYGRDWDLKMLAQVARRYKLEPLTVIGDDLQRHCTRYYHNEHYLTLAILCERLGVPLPAQTSLDRARGQIAVLWAMATAITEKQSFHAPAPTTATLNEGDGETLEDLDDDEHPF